MVKILFLDLDGTVRLPKSNPTFIKTPEDQELIPGFLTSEKSRECGECGECGENEEELRHCAYPERFVQRSTSHPSQPSHPSHPSHTSHPMSEKFGLLRAWQKLLHVTQTTIKSALPTRKSALTASTVLRLGRKPWNK